LDPDIFERDTALMEPIVFMTRWPIRSDHDFTLLDPFLWYLRELDDFLIGDELGLKLVQQLEDPESKAIYLQCIRQIDPSITTILPSLEI